VLQVLWVFSLLGFILLVLIGVVAQRELLDRANVVRNGTDDQRDPAALVARVDPKPCDARNLLAAGLWHNWNLGNPGRHLTDYDH
jgi:hypothetical protein